MKSKLTHSRLVIVCLALIVTATLCWNRLEARQLSSIQDVHATLIRRLEEMVVDAAAIEKLSQSPRLATDRERLNDELLVQVRDALSAAKVPHDRWIGNDPSAPRRIAKSPYKRLDTQLQFKNITLKQMTTLCHKIFEADATLAISRLDMSAPQSGNKAQWDIKMTLNYLLYAPGKQK